MKRYRNITKLDGFEVYRPAAKQIRAVAPAQFKPRDAITRRQKLVGWFCRIIAAAIMVETLFFKFTGAPESVYIFSKMNMEAWWRYGQGIWELIASILLLIPRLGWAGGILTMSAMSAAVLSHFTVLGIAVQGDHGLLFGMGVVTLMCGAIVTFIHRYEIPNYEPIAAY